MGSSSKLFIITSCPSVEGYKITRHYGLVFGETVHKTSLFKSIGSNIKDFGNSLHIFSEREMTGITGLIQNAQEYAIQKMKEAALSRGANAIVGVDCESSFGNDEFLHISMYGTAVKIESSIEQLSLSSDDSDQDADASGALTVLSCNKTNFDEEFTVYQLALLGDNLAKIVVSSKKDIDGIKLHFDTISVFKEQRSSESIEVTGFQKRYESLYESLPFEIPGNINTLVSAKELHSIIEKYVIEDEVYSVDCDELKPIEKRKENIEDEVLDLMKQNVGDEVGFLFINPSSGDTAATLYECLESNVPDENDPAIHYLLSQLKKTVYAEERFHKSKKDEFLNNLEKWRMKYMEFLLHPQPIIIDESSVRCPLCGTRQQSSRETCFLCQINFRDVNSSTTDDGK